jgi:hypothetical protein
MLKNNVTDPITDREIAFARLVLAGTMNDRQAAEAVGLNPDTASDTKAKPGVRDYMLGYRAAAQQRLAEEDTEKLRRFNLNRDRVLARLWEIADLGPEKTRNGMSAQVKALSMIIAIEGLIPDRRAVAAQSKPAPPPADPPFYVSEWMRTRQEGQSVNPQPSPSQEEASPETQSAPRGADDPVPTPDLPPTELSSSRPVVKRPERSEVEGPAFPGPLNTSQITPPLPRVPMADYCAPDTRRPFSRDNRFGRCR